MKKKFGNPLGLAALAVNYLRNRRKLSAEGGQANDVTFEIIQNIPPDLRISVSQK